jgi:hypothetical protein
MTDSPRTHVDERRSARGCDHGRGQHVGEEEQGEGRKDERDVRRRRKRWCTHDVKHPRGRAIATGPLRESVSGLQSDEYGEEAHAPTPSVKNGVARRWRNITPGFKEQSRVHLIHAPKKTTYIITECIEINVKLIRVFIT